MSILGKVLIVFNLLAAGAFAYFTLENRKVRKDLTRAAVVRDIQLDGCPVEQPAVPPRGPGQGRRGVQAGGEQRPLRVDPEGHDRRPPFRPGVRPSGPAAASQSPTRRPR